MLRRRLHAPHPFSHVNVTPMIDVVMCMIVFYLIVGKLVAETRSPLALPPARSGKSQAEKDLLVINVAGAGRIEVEGELLEADALTALVASRVRGVPATVVQVRAARDLPYGAVDPVLAACRQAGVGTVRLSTEHIP